MSLFILHEAEVALEAYRQAWDALADAWVDEIDRQRDAMKDWFDACWRPMIRGMVETFARKWIADIQRAEDRRARKRKQAARARCGRRR